MLLAAGVARAQDASAEADAYLAAGRPGDAGDAYRRAFDQTRDPAFLKKAGQAYMQMGPAGRDRAVETFTVYTRYARNIDEAREAQALLAEARAMPAPAAPAPPPPPPAPATPTPPPAAPPPEPPVDPAAVQWEERNPAYVSAMPEPPLLGEEATSAALAAPGFRLSVAPGVAAPTGDFHLAGIETSFNVLFRVGGEFMSDGFGASPAVRAEYVRWANAGDVPYNFVHVGADIRLAGHQGRLVGYFSFGVGADLSMIDEDEAGFGGFDVHGGKGFGLHAGGGLDVLLTPSVALTFAVTFHPGFTDVYQGDDVPDEVDFDVSYLAFNVGIGIY